MTSPWVLTKSRRTKRYKSLHLQLAKEVWGRRKWWVREFWA